MVKSARSVTEGPKSKLRYSHALRCIGQSLESKDLKALELKINGDSYLIQGWNKGTSMSLDLEKCYTADDLKTLEIEGKRKRKAQPGLPNLLSLSQVLRLAGNYVDRMQGRLLRVSWQDQSDKIQSITIQYEQAPIERPGQNDSQFATIEELCLHVYKQRKKISAGTDKYANRPLVSVGGGN
jgi:hypothetical protein